MGAGAKRTRFPRTHSIAMAFPVAADNEASSSRFSPSSSLQRPADFNALAAFYSPALVVTDAGQTNAVVYECRHYFN